MISHLLLLPLTYSILLLVEKHLLSLIAMADLSGTGKLADPTLLEAIDKLFELNIGEYVALPQVKHSITDSP